MKEKSRSTFSGNIGFVLAAAGSAVGLGNIWRFPYLAAKDGGGLFLLVYLILVLTFGFALLTTEIAIGRKTGQGPLTAYGLINPKGKFIGVLACIVPAIILPYYCTIGGWVLKYFTLFITGSGKNAVADGYFTGFITGQWAPIIFGVVYLLITAAVVIGGVNKGIERFSKVLMPILVVLIFAIGIFSLTLNYKDASGAARSGLEGLKIYVVPDFKGLTMQKLVTVFVDALGQLFYSISVAMGIMVAYGSYVKKESKLMGSINQIEIFDTLVPAIILPYYCTIGGWVLKYFTLFITGSGKNAVADGYFTGFITGQWAPIIFGVVYLLITAAVVIGGVNKGIERFSKVLMPILVVLIFAIGIFSLTLNYKDASGAARSGLEGLKIYVVPDFKGLTMQKLVTVFVDALGQLFYSISVAMGIMVAYGSYVKKESKLMGSINQIEIFDTLVAFLAGLMIIPAVYVFMGRDGMSAGPGLMFISLPKVFNEMGIAGDIVGLIFFMIVAFAAVTSSVSIMEAIVSSLIDRFHWSRRKSAILVTVYGLIAEIIVCLGYNKLYMEVKLPNGTVGQILDIMDYVSNNVLMPIVALATCILVGWIVSPKVIIDEVTRGGSKFTRKGLYIIMVKFIAPAFLLILLLQALGIVTF